MPDTCLGVIQLELRLPVWEVEVPPPVEDDADQSGHRVNRHALEVVCQAQ